MVVLGISETHCATAAVLRDGAIVGCASEERFSRLKNDAGYPHLAIDADRVRLVDHHTCHAAAAYFGSPFAGAPALVLTNDNSGDGLCATASRGRGVTLERSEATPSGPGSLGSFYTLVTLLLGMKPGEHEYEVMGLAPYAPAGSTDRAAAALRVVFDFADGRPCRFEWRKRGPLYRALLEATLALRFDWGAGGAQRILEESLLAWARRMRERYGAEPLALGGGVLSYVKENMLPPPPPWAAELLVLPSCGDESDGVDPRDPREPVGPPRGAPDQSDDQEPRLLDAVRPVGAARARGGLSGQPQGARLALHDARVPDQPEAA